MLSRLLPRLILTFVLLCCCLSTSVLAGTSANLLDQPLVRERAATTLSDQARTYLENRNSEQARVWVFFTDKGATSKSGFDRLAASVTLTDRALKRRAKVGRDHVLFVDLPVHADYVNQLVGLGAEHRRSSRWLNAASFDIPWDRMATIEEQGFVAWMKPLAGFSGSSDVEVDLRSITPDEAQSPDALGYGQSYGQLAQIGVTDLHDMGYTGEGVTLTIMDTGFRKSHDAFAAHLAAGRVIAEWDFVNNDGNTANEGADWSSQWNHGTYIWSVSAGESPNNIYGPGYRANIILCKTEDLKSETPVEEDNWVAALEFADSVGTDVITTSLGYSDWYTYDDVDGQTATITLAANTCDGLGIVMCNSMGNSGPSAGSLTPPADAFDILSVGNVNSAGNLSSSSSRGPTYDGRMKPAVCAQGTSTRCASAGGDASYTYASGTSLSTPLVAGAAVLMIEAHPTYSPELIREAMKLTSTNAATPDNSYGWGILNMELAVGFGAEFSADVDTGEAPLTVQFTEESTLAPTAWFWEFGDGDYSVLSNPQHTYLQPGTYDVSLTLQTSLGEVSSVQPDFIRLKGDTLSYGYETVFAGEKAIISVSLNNSQALTNLIIPFRWSGGALTLGFDSVSLGSRTGYFETIRTLSYDFGGSMTVELVANDGGGSPALPPGDGEVLRLHLNTDRYALGGLTSPVDSGIIGAHKTTIVTESWSYEPFVFGGSLSTKPIQRGDVDYSQDGMIDIIDLTYLIGYLFILGDPPVTVQSGDFNGDLIIDGADLNDLIGFLFIQGDPPVYP